MIELRTMNHPVVRLRSEMDRLFENVMANTGLNRSLNAFGRRNFPAINVWEDEKNLFAEAEVPGIGMEKLEVLVAGDELTIKGEHRSSDDKEATYHRRERGIGRFERTVQLPCDVNAEKVEASLRDGVLLVTLAKADAVLPRRIEVKS